MLLWLIFGCSDDETSAEAEKSSLEGSQAAKNHRRYRMEPYFTTIYNPSNANPLVQMDK